ncbi:MAG: hypothetical protein ACYDCX_03030 [Acidithiobacillus sp.]
MKSETITIQPKAHKPRFGVMPTRAEQDRTKYTRKAKHRTDYRNNGRDSGAVCVRLSA